MLSCAFFGHRDLDYYPYWKKIEEIIVELIESGVTVFYHGNRGRFEATCTAVLIELREKYPHIKHVLVLSYLPDNNFVLPFCFDYAIHLQDINAPKRFAISYTNRKLIESVDYVVVAACRNHGGAKAASDYAKKMFRPVINVLTDEKQYYLSAYEKEQAVKQFNDYHERMNSDEEFRKAEEKKNRQSYEKTAAVAERRIARNKKIKREPAPIWIKVNTTN